MNNKKMIRAERIAEKMLKLREAMDFIENHLPTSPEEFKDKMLRNAVYKEVEYAIELVIDMFNIVNADLRTGVPETEDSVFDNLERAKVFDGSIIQKIRDMKKFRNVLVHKYGDIKDEEAYEDIKNGLKDFEMIMDEIERVVKSTNSAAKNSRSSS